MWAKLLVSESKRQSSQLRLAKHAGAPPSGSPGSSALPSDGAGFPACQEGRGPSHLPSQRCLLLPNRAPAKCKLASGTESAGPRSELPPRAPFPVENFSQLLYCCIKKSNRRGILRKCGKWLEDWLPVLLCFENQLDGQEEELIRKQICNNVSDPSPRTNCPTSHHREVHGHHVQTRHCHSDCLVSSVLLPP